MNKVTLIGRTGKNPEIKTFENGDRIANVSLATTERYKDKQGNKKEITDWHNLVFSGPVVGVVEQYVSKGSQIAIEGSIKTRSYETDGVTKYVTEVRVRDLELLGGGQTQQQSQTVDEELGF